LTQVKKTGSLLDGIQNLAGALRSVDPVTLADATGIVFARSLDYKQYSEGTAQANLVYDARRVAAFVIINQIFFYQALVLSDPHYSLLVPSQTIIVSIRNAFSEVAKTSFAPIFVPNILDRLPEDDQIIAELNVVVTLARESTLRGDSTWTQGFARLIPLEIRKHIAAFYTSPVGAQVLANLCIESPHDVILDLACGTGTLLVRAYQRKRDLLQQQIQTPPEQLIRIHHQFLQDLYGNDAVPFAAHLAAMNLALQGPLLSPPPINVTTGDGFQVYPHSLASPSFIPAVDIVLMNPPFTRHERVAPDFTRAIQESLVNDGYGSYLAGKMSLQHYFLFHADSFLGHGGRLAFVLPANTFNVGLSQKLIRFLEDKKYHIKYLVTLNSRTGAFSEDCNYKEYLFVAVKGSLTKSSVTKLVLLSDLPSLEQVEKFTESLRTSQGSTSFEQGGVKMDVTVVSTHHLYAAEKWDPAFWDLNDPLLLSILTQSTKLIPLLQSREFKFVTGFHSTHCEYLIFPNRLFKVTRDLGDAGLEICRRADNARVVIPRSLLRPCLRESKLYQGIYAKPAHWVLSADKSTSLSDDLVNIFLNYTTQILKEQIRSKAIKGGKIRERLDPFWYTHPRATGCDSKVGHCWTFNRYGLWRRNNAAFYTETIVTGNDGFHIYDYVGTDVSKEESLQVLTSWFNTSLHLFDFLCKCRVPATHVQQCLKPDRALMYVPIVNRLTPAERESLLIATQQFAQTMDGTLIDQLNSENRRNLDEAWLRILGIDPLQISSILHRLYPILKEIIQAR